MKKAEKHFMEMIGEGLNEYITDYVLGCLPLIQINGKVIKRRGPVARIELSNDSGEIFFDCNDNYYPALKRGDHIIVQFSRAFFKDGKIYFFPQNDKIIINGKKYTGV